MTLSATPAPIGHNSQAGDLFTPIKENFVESYNDNLKRAMDLAEAASRIPETIEDDEQGGKVTEYLKQISVCNKHLEAARVAEKEPYLTLTRQIDAFFKAPQDSLNQIGVKVKTRLDMYLKKKADAERERRAQEAKRLQDEADQKAKEALELEENQQPRDARVALSEAIHNESEAAKMEKSVSARPSQLAQSRSESGSSASLRTVWIGQLEDRATVDLEALRPYLNPDDIQKAINAFVRAGGRELRGATIFERSETVVR